MDNDSVTLDEALDRFTKVGVGTWLHKDGGPSFSNGVPVYVYQIGRWTKNAVVLIQHGCQGPSLHVNERVCEPELLDAEELERVLDPDPLSIYRIITFCEAAKILTDWSGRV